MGATLIASNNTRYNNGTAWSDESSLAGIHPDDNHIRVVRYTFTTSSLGAVSYSILLSGVSKHREYDPTLRFCLTSSATGYETAGSTYAYDGTLSRRASTSGYGQYEYYADNVQKTLAPNTTYYLWVFPGTTSVGCAFLPCDVTQYATDLASMTLGLAPGYVSFSEPNGTTTYGTNKTFTVSSHGGTLSVKSSNTSVATVSISGNTVTMVPTGAGTTNITVTSNATSSYTSASDVYTLTVYKASGSVTTRPKAKILTYSGADQTLVEAGYGTGTILYSTTSPSSGFSAALPSMTNAGTYTVWYYAAESANYKQSSTYSVGVTIGPAQGYVTLSDSSGSTAYGSNKTFNVTRSHGGALSVKSSDTSVATVSINGTTVTVVPNKGGSVVIMVTCAATANYTAAYASYELSVSRTPGWISLSATSGTVVYGNAGSFTVSSHHGGALSVGSSNQSVATASVSGSTVSISPRGNGVATLTVTSASTDQYNAASATYTVTVHAGLVYIDNGTSFVAYQCYIDNGTSWDLYLPYIDNGSGWDLAK